MLIATRISRGKTSPLRRMVRNRTTAAEEITVQGLSKPKNRQKAKKPEGEEARSRGSQNPFSILLDMVASFSFAVRRAPWAYALSPRQVRFSGFFEEIGSQILK